MKLNISKIKVLIYKNYLLFKRSIISSLVSLIFPSLLILIICYTLSMSNIYKNSRTEITTPITYYTSEFISNYYYTMKNNETDEYYSYIKNDNPLKTIDRIAIIGDCSNISNKECIDFRLKNYILKNNKKYKLCYRLVKEKIKNKNKVDFTVFNDLNNILSYNEYLNDKANYEDCQIDIYNTYEDYVSYINSNEYIKENLKYELAIELINTNNNNNNKYLDINSIKANVYVSNMQIKSLFDSLDNFNVIPKIESYENRNFKLSINKLIFDFKLNLNNNNNNKYNNKHYNLKVKLIPNKSSSFYINKNNINIPNADVSIQDFESSFKVIIPYIVSAGALSILMRYFDLLIREKSKNTRNFLHQHSVSVLEYNISYFVFFLIEQTIPLILSTIFLKYYVLYNTSLFIILITLILYYTNIYSLSLFISQIVKSKESGQVYITAYFFISIAISVVFNLSSSTYFSNDNSNIFYSILLNVIYYAMLSSPIMICNKCFDILVISRNLPNGFRILDYDLWFNSYKGTSYIVNLFLLLINSLILLFISYHLHCKDYRKNNTASYIKKNITNLNNSNTFNSKSLIIKDINKTYKEEKNTITNNLFDKNNSDSHNIRPALNKFNAIFNKNEIYALLGQNGAGKSTLLNILCGVIETNSGEIYYNNYNLLENKYYMHSILSYTSQENIFYENLTVDENITIVKLLKQSINNKNEDNFEYNNINILLKKTKLLDKRNKIASTLSGGQQRKLCILFSFLVDSKIVVLDEPTSGVDVNSKKDVWNLIKELKEERIVILTTHSLNEAEVLGDKIGIMKNGKLECEGDSVSLRGKYNYGINICLNFNLIDIDNESNINLPEYIVSYFKIICINFIESYVNNNNDNNFNINKDELIKNIELNIRNSNKYSILINLNIIECRNINKPLNNNTYTNLNKDLFNYLIDLLEQIIKNNSILDNNIKNTAYIHNYSVSSATLEDVFLKITDNDLFKNKSIKYKNEFNSIVEYLNPYKKSNKYELSNANKDLISVNLNYSTYTNKNLYKNKFVFKSICYEIWRHIENIRTKKLLTIFQIIVSIFLVIYMTLISLIPQYIGINTFNLLTVSDKILVGYSKDINYLIQNNDINLDYLGYFEDKYNNIEVIDNNKMLNNNNKISLSSEEVNFDSFVYNYNALHNVKLGVYLYISDNNKKNKNITELSSIVIYSNSIENYMLSSIALLDNIYLRLHNLDSSSSTIFYNYNSINNIQMLDEGTLSVTNQINYGTTYYYIMSSLIGYASYCVYTPAKERISKLKQSLEIANINKLVYWSSLFVVDLLKMSIVIVLNFVFICIQSIHNNQYLNDTFINELTYVFIFSLSLGFSLISFAYFISLFSNNEEKLQSLYNKINFISMFLIIPSLIYHNNDISSKINDTDKNSNFYFTLLNIIKYDKNLNDSIVYNILSNSYLFNTKFYFSFHSLTPSSQILITFIRLMIYKFSPLKSSKGSLEELIIYSILILFMQFVVYNILISIVELKIIEYYLFRLITFLRIKFIIILNYLKDTRVFKYVKYILFNLINFRRINSNNIELINNSSSSLYDNNMLINEINSTIELSNSNLINKYTNSNIQLEQQTPSLIINNISKTYNNLFLLKYVKAIDNNFNIELTRKESLGLLGYNGSGKSTLFKSLIKEIFIDTGEIAIIEKDNKIIINKDILPLRNFINCFYNSINDCISYCPQSNYFIENLTVYKNIDYFVSIIKNNYKFNEEITYSHHHIIINILNVFGLIDYSETKAKNLSGGNKRKLCFTIALLSNKKLILLDEPTTGVDPKSRQIMWNCLKLNEISNTYRNLSNNLIISTHLPEEAEVLCDKLCWLNKGKINMLGNSEELKKQIFDGYYINILLKLSDSNLIHIFKNKEFITSCNVNTIDKAKLNKEFKILLNAIVSLFNNIKLEQLEKYFDKCLKDIYNFKTYDLFDCECNVILTNSESKLIISYIISIIHYLVNIKYVNNLKEHLIKNNFINNDCDFSIENILEDNSYISLKTSYVLSNKSSLIKYLLSLKDTIINIDISNVLNLNITDNYLFEIIKQLTNELNKINDFNLNFIVKDLTIKLESLDNVFTKNSTDSSI